MSKISWILTISYFGIWYLISHQEFFAWLMLACIGLMFMSTPKRENKPPEPPDNWWEDVHTGD